MRFVRTVRPAAIACSVLALLGLAGQARAAAEPAAAIQPEYDPKNLSGMWRQVKSPFLDAEQWKAFARTLVPPGVEPPAADPKTATNGNPELPLRYTPEFQPIHDKFAADYKAGNPYRIALHCISGGMFQMMVRLPTLEIFHMDNPDRFFFKGMLVGSEYRVFVNGKHPAEYIVKPELYGHSIGRWEGDTLVVDTENTGAHAVISETEPQSQSMHIVQRMSRPAYDTLMIDFFAEDKRAWLTPIRTKLVYKLNPNFRAPESQCFDDGWGQEPIEPAPE